MHLKDGIVGTSISIHSYHSAGAMLFSKKKIATLSAILLIFLIFIPMITFGGETDIAFFQSDNSDENSDIKIINIKSFPIVEGKWIVKFTTEGNADLKITATNKTTWSNSNNKEDLRFLYIKNGNEIVDYRWIDNSVIVENYSSDTKGYISSKVLTAGKHTLKFSFEKDVEFAYNDASALTYLINDTKTDVFGYKNNSMTNISYDNSVHALKLNASKTTGNYISRVFDGGSNTKWNNLRYNVTHNNRSSDIIGYMWDQTGNESLVFYRNLSYSQDNFVDNTDNEIDFGDASANWSLPTDASVDNITGMCFDSDNNDAYAFLKNGSYIVDRNFDPTDAPSDLSFSDDFGTYSLLSGYNTDNILGFVFDNDGDEMLVFYDDGNYSGDSEILSADSAINFNSYNGNYTLPETYSFSNVLGFNFMEAADDMAVFFDDYTFFKNLSFTPFTDPPWKDINFSEFNGNAKYKTNVTLIDLTTSVTFQIRSDDDNSSWSEFIGPDGTNSTYYSNKNGQNLIVADNRYFQYKTFFSTTNETITPYLHNVTIRYKNNQRPKTSLISPHPNGTIDVTLRPTCSIWANDTDGDNLDVYFYENTTGIYVLRNSSNGVSANSTVSYSFSEFNIYNTTYYWSVRVFDGDLWKNTTYYFTTEQEPNIAPKINSYDLKNMTGSKLNNETGLIDNNQEYYFSINVTDRNGWEDIDYINITAWFDNGDDNSEYNDTAGGNLNMFLQYKNLSGTGQFNLIWPDDEVEIILANCSESVVNSSTKIINISFKTKDQVRRAPGDGSWDNTQNSTNDINSWNFKITVKDSSNLSCSKKDEYGISPYTYIKKEAKYLYVNVIPGYTAETNVITIDYSTNYDFKLSVYFEKNLSNSTSGSIIPIENNVYILEKADLNDDITTDMKFNGTGENNKIEVYSNSGLFKPENNSQTLNMQFEIGVPIGTYSGTYNSKMATHLFQKEI